MHMPQPLAHSCMVERGDCRQHRTASLPTDKLSRHTPSANARTPSEVLGGQEGSSSSGPASPSCAQMRVTNFPTIWRESLFLSLVLLGIAFVPSSSPQTPQMAVHPPPPSTWVFILAMLSLRYWSRRHNAVEPAAWIGAPDREDFQWRPNLGIERPNPFAMTGRFGRWHAFDDKVRVRQLLRSGTFCFAIPLATG